jgi:hypothetical protein
MTPEEAMDRRDALIERLLEMTGPEGKDAIFDLILAEHELDHALRERIRARAALRT